MKILYSWTGIRELEDAKKALPESKALFDKHLKGLRPQRPNGSGGEGYVRRALTMKKYDRLVVLVDYRSEKMRDEENDFREAYGKSFSGTPVEVKVESVVIRDPEDYAEVYQEAKRILQETVQPGAELDFLLSSGTYPMTLCWILLGKTLFEGARFLRERSGKLVSFDIPLDLTAEYIPQKLKGRDDAFQGLYDGFEDIVGDSILLKKAQGDAHRAAMHGVNVLLVGESGTGKEMFAEAIRKASPRRNEEHREINCAAIPDALLEDKLFGHVKGAFTGANHDTKGLFEEADKGTLFLDEIEACSPAMQSKLLRVLQPPSDKPLTYREYSPVGNNEEPKHSDVRIIAATNRDLGEMAKERIGEKGSFRSDLLYRLSAIVIHIPPLRERPEDILPTAEALLKRTNELLKETPGYENKKFCKKTRNVIQKYTWPGNVRELSNAILRGAIMSNGDTILPDDLGISVSDNQAVASPVVGKHDSTHGIDINAHLQEELRKWVEKALENTKTKKEAAEWLGLKSAQALDSKLRTLGMEYRKK